MDPAWIDQLIEQLGPRYIAKRGTERTEIHYRGGKREFHPSRFYLRERIEVVVDVRIPKGTSDAEATPLVEALDAQTMIPRGFRKTDDRITAMKNQNGEEAGTVRSLTYDAEFTTPGEAARHIRAIVESVDIPLVVGIHEIGDAIARDPRPPPPKPKVAKNDELDTLRFRLISSFSRDLSVFVDQNNRTLRVVERNLLSSRTLRDNVKLAHIGRFVTRQAGGKYRLIAIDREGGETLVAEAPGGTHFLATAERLARGVRIPIESDVSK